MGERNLRRVRYSRSNPRPSITVPALTAASMPVDPQSKQFKNPMSLAGRMGWQTEAWDMMDRVGELRYFVSWRASSCSRVRLVASEMDSEGMPTGKCRNPRVRDIVGSIGGGQLGASQFIKRAVECLTVPGETFMAVIFDAKTEQEKWIAFSRDEIRKTSQNGTIVEMPDGTDHLLGPDDSLWRTWMAHPRKAKDSDSPVRSSLPSLREIVQTTATINDAGKSRLLGAGILFVPTEMSLPATNAPVSADRPGDVVAVQGVTAAQLLEETLYQVMRASHLDEDSYARHIPIIASVSGDMIKNVNHLKFDTEFQDEALKTRNDAIARLALGLDVSPERLLGIGGSTNHWSAWQIGDNDVQLHVAPVMETICDSLTKEMLWGMLEEEGIDPTKYVVWYDAGQLTVDPDKTDDATAAFDRGALTADALREYLGLSDDGYDLVNGGLPAWQAWAADIVSKDPKNLPGLLPLLDPVLHGLEGLIPAAPPVAVTDGTDKPASDSSGGGDSNAGSKPNNTGNDPETEKDPPGADQGKRGKKSTVGKSLDRQDPFVRVFVTRALELAGKRRRGRDPVLSDRLRGHKAHEYHRLMDPVPASEIDPLIKGWNETLEDDVLAILGVDREDFEAAVRAEVRRQLTVPVITVGS